MRRIRALSLHFTLLLFVAVTWTPLLWVALSSFKSDIEIRLQPLGWPTEFRFINYVDTWADAKVNVYFMNSVIVATIATVVTLLFASMTSFALTRLPFKRLNRWLTMVLLLGMVVPASALLIPLYFLIIDLHIYNTYLSLIFPYITFALPLAVFITAAFMKSLPLEMEEAAVIDGSSVYNIYSKVVMPLTVPVLVTVFVLTFISNWNEFVMANFYLESDRLRTLPVGMASFRDQFRTQYSKIAVGIIYSVVPVLAVYAVLQEKIIVGLTEGSIKG